MTKQDFISLGATEEQATKFEEASKKELEGYVPKSKFDEERTAKEAAEKSVNTLTKDLEAAKKNAGDNEELKKQLETAIETQKTEKANHENEMKELKLTNAISVAIAGKCHDASLVASLFDKSKLILSDDGKVSGLEEQLKGLQKDKAFLFKQDSQQQQQNQNQNNQQQQRFGFQVGSGGNQQQQQNKPKSLHDAIASHFANSQQAQQTGTQQTGQQQ